MAVARLVRRPNFYGSRQFCGPTALSILTGKSTDDAVDVLHYLRGNNLPVKSTSWHEFMKASSILGSELIEKFPKSRISLSRWHREIGYHEFNKTIVVLITNHFTTIRNGIIVDTWYPDGIPLSKSAHGRKSVLAWAVAK